MAHAPLTLYVDPAWKRHGLHTPLLFPFWGNPTEDVSLFAKEIFNTYAFDTSLYTLTHTLERADMVLAPYRHNWLLQYDPALLDTCAAVAKAAGVPLLIDAVGDVESPCLIENTYLLRIGGYRFIFEKGRIQIPPASDDLLERCVAGQLQIRKKTQGKPVVGFAGWAELTLGQMLRTFIKELPYRIRGLIDSRYRAMKKGVLWRGEALRILAASPVVDLVVKKRSSFSGSAKTAEKDMKTLRQELVDTVLQSDYCLDVRGDANDSTRLFEILSLGRIPVVVDTERNFPFSEEVEYRDFCLIVDFRDIQRLPDIIAQFHASVSPEQFEDMQRKARDAFVRHFRIDAQTQHIVQKLSKVV